MCYSARMALMGGRSAAPGPRERVQLTGGGQVGAVHEAHGEQPVAGHLGQVAVGQDGAQVGLEHGPGAVVRLVVGEHDGAVGAEDPDHGLDVPGVAVGRHGLEALEVGGRQHVGEVPEQRAAGAGGRVVPAGLPAAPAQRDAGVGARRWKMAMVAR